MSTTLMHTQHWAEGSLVCDSISLQLVYFFTFDSIFFMLCSVQPKLVFKLKVKLEHYRQQRTCSHKEKGMNQENYYLLPMTIFTVFRITNKKINETLIHFILLLSLWKTSTRYTFPDISNKRQWTFCGKRFSKALTLHLMTLTHVHIPLVEWELIKLSWR